jgi:hypothetical protein
MKKTIVIIIFLSFCIATSVLANEKRNHFGMFYTPRFDYFSSKEMEVKDWFSYNTTSRYNHEAGLTYVRSGRINKHISLIYSTYRFDANYSYSFDVSDDETVGKEYFDLRKINLEIGASKTIFKTDIISISPLIYMGLPSPLISSTVTSYNINNEVLKMRSFDFVSLENQMYKLPYLGVSIGLKYPIKEYLVLEASPFIKAYFNVFSNQDKHYSPMFSFGATVCLYIKN